MLMHSQKALPPSAARELIPLPNRGRRTLRASSFWRPCKSGSSTTHAASTTVASTRPGEGWEGRERGALRGVLHAWTDRVPGTRSATSSVTEPAPAALPAPREGGRRSARDQGLATVSQPDAAPLGSRTCWQEFGAFLGVGR